MSGELNGCGFGFPVTLVWEYENFEANSTNSEVPASNKLSYVVPTGYDLFVVGSQLTARDQEWLSVGTVAATMKRKTDESAIANFPGVTASTGSAASNNVSRFVSAGACRVGAGELVTVYLNTSSDFSAASEAVVVTCLVYGYLRPA